LATAALSSCVSPDREPIRWEDQARTLQPGAPYGSSTTEESDWYVSVRVPVSRRIVNMGGSSLSPFHVYDPKGSLVREIREGDGLPVAMPPGRYILVPRAGSSRHSVQFRIAAGQVTFIDASNLQ